MRPAAIFWCLLDPASEVSQWRRRGQGISRVCKTRDGEVDYVWKHKDKLFAPKYVVKNLSLTLRL